MNQDNERDLDKRIADLIKDKIVGRESEEYIPGAWEGFLSRRAALAGKRRMLLYRLSSAAAVLVVLAGLFFLTPYDSKTPPVLVVQMEGSSETSLTDSAVAPQPLVAEVIPEASKLKTERVPVKEKAGKSDSFEKGEAQNPTREARSKTVTEPVTEPVTESETQSKPATQTQTQTQTGTQAQNNTQPKNETQAQPRRIPEAEQGQTTLGRYREKDRRALRFGVNVSPGFNSSSGSSGSFNYAGGVSLDIAIAKNVSISTGVQIEHQDVESRTSDGGGRAAMPASYTDATLTNLDIPINVTWRFHTGSSGSYYVSGGVSTLAYVDEKYTNTSYRQEVKGNIMYDAPEESVVTYKVENVEVVKELEPSPSNAFDVAGRLNLMIGYEQRISPRLNLHIEPFVKIPLSGLASQNIRFTTGGVTFKVSF